MSLINIVDLTFSYEGSPDVLFEEVAFQIDTNWKLGFIGRNGRGKTTFLKLLESTDTTRTESITGERKETYEFKGQINHSVRFSYFPFVVEDEDLLVWEVVDSIHPDCQIWQLKKELKSLQMEEEILYRPFYSLSKGEGTKVLLAVLFLKENNFLLIDEPTNHLDREGREVVSKYLQSKEGFILVSHDRKFLDGCIDHVLSINKTNIEVQKGNFSSWSFNKERQDQFELAEHIKLKKDIKRLSQAAKQAAQWSGDLEKTKYGVKIAGLRPDRGHIGHQAAKMMQRAKSIDSRRQNAVEEKEKLLKNIETADGLQIRPLPYHTQNLVRLKDLSIQYGDKKVCKNINFTVEQGDRIVLEGKNGSGKTSILNLISGEALSYTGEVQVGSQLVISYVSQDTSSLKGNLSNYAREYGIEERLLKTILRKLDFERGQLEKNMEEFSEGQKKKVLIARSLCERAHLYIWDEPLNFIDLLSRIQIEELIENSNMTLLFVEHDKTFAEKIGNKKVEL